MARIRWEGVPAQYWPSTEKPWRVAWGLGGFEDFETEAEAWVLYEELLAGDMEALEEPFDATLIDG